MRAAIGGSNKEREGRGGQEREYEEELLKLRVIQGVV